MLQTHHTQEAAVALPRVQPYLAAEPVGRNLLMTQLTRWMRSNEPVSGRYWWATEGESVVGFALQAPIEFKALLAAESSEAIDSLAAAMYQTNPGLPAVAAEAWTAARFAGAWTELNDGAAEPSEGERLYQLDRLMPPTEVTGSARRATQADVTTVAEWHVGFCSDVGVEPDPDPLQAMSSRIGDRRIWVWDDGGIVAMAAATAAIAGASRIGHVYTPPARRGHGYAAAITAAATADALAEGADHCLLYTQLANPTSNAVYRRIGYRPVEERLTYRLRRAR